MTTIPSDPFMLMSYVNQQLRDNYDSLDEFCKSIDIDKNELLQKLNAAGFEYNPDTNKFWQQQSVSAICEESLNIGSPLLLLALFLHLQS